MKNTIYTADNLFVLNGMKGESVDLIYLDPPFNSGREFNASKDSDVKGASFEDIWEWKDVDKHCVYQLIKEYAPALEYIFTIEEAHSNAMMAYITYMAQRLIQMKRVLKKTGSIYLHCNSTASHYLKVLMDYLFGKDNFRNEIVWHHPKIGVASKKWTANTDIILYYLKDANSKYTYNRQVLDEPNELYTRWEKKIRDDKKLYYREAKTINDDPARSKMRVQRKKLGRELKDDDIIVDFTKEANKKRRDNVWKIPSLKGNSKECRGFRTQKPRALLDPIIRASSNKGDVVLDPFCGSATTMISAHMLGRRWIGIDVKKQTGEYVEKRLKGEQAMYSDFELTKKIPNEREEELISSKHPSVKKRLYDRQEGKCKSCNVHFEEERHFYVDHCIPKSKGGGDYFENYQLLCPDCNSVKGDRSMAFLLESMEKRKEMRIRS